MGIFEKWLESLDYEFEILTSCTRYSAPRSTCQACIEACEEEAIFLENEKPIIDHEKCTECGKCISACPVQGVAGIYPRRSYVQNKLVINETDVIPTAKELVILRAKGIKEIIFRTDRVIKAWLKPVDEANVMLGELGEKPYEVVSTVKLHRKEESLTRRELFSFWRKESSGFIKLATPAKWRFNHEDFNLSKHYPDYQFYRVTIDENKCTVCLACQRVCPLKCFEFQDEQLLVSSQQCTSCRICADICPEKAIIIENKIVKKESEPVRLTIYKNQCTTCERKFDALTEDETTCIICKKRALFNN